ncbi:SIR2 family protein [Weissella confusa]|uniref:SIR2 family protein n=1 Tax=Weissella confusa TaxID=1583 RepID=UPI00376ED8FC
MVEGKAKVVNDIPYGIMAGAIGMGKATSLIGTGMSMFFTNGKMPTFKQLIQRTAAKLDVKKTELKEMPAYNDKNYPLVAEILSKMDKLENNNNGGYHKIVSDVIREVEKEVGFETPEIVDFQEMLDVLKGRYKLITTNYDHYLENVFPNDRTEIYHIHGQVDDEQAMVVGMADYYNFSTNASYMKHKFATLLEEDVIIILGYSLGDYDLNEILFEATRSQNLNVQEKIYYVTREKVDSWTKKVYSDVFKTHVIDEVEIPAFFEKLVNAKLKYAESGEWASLEAIKKPQIPTKDTDGDVIDYLEYFKKKIVGVSLQYRISDEASLKPILEEIEEFKKDSVQWQGWDGYTALAQSLLLLLKNVDMTKASIDILDKYKELVLYSWESSATEAKEYWHAFDAFKVWSQANELIKDQQAMDILKTIYRDNIHKAEGYLIADKLKSWFA